VCALAVVGVLVAVGLTNDTRDSTVTAATTTVVAPAPSLPTTSVAQAPSVVRTNGIAPTTGEWRPITVNRPKIPIIAGGIPVDVDPSVSRTDFSTTLYSVGVNRYRMTVFNASTLGAINSFQWYPPTGVRIVKVIGSSQGRCILTGLSGFGGNQFPTIVLYPNILCDKLDLTAASCTCRGDGGSVSITFVTNKGLAVNEGDLRLRTATLAFERIPITPATKALNVRHVKRIVAAAGSAGGLTADERDDAHHSLGPERPVVVPGRPRVAEPDHVQGLPLLGSLARSRAVRLAHHEHYERSQDEHVPARCEPACSTRRPAGRERPEGQSPVGRHHPAVAVRRGASAEESPAPRRAWRRRLREAGYIVRGAQEREPQTASVVKGNRQAAVLFGDATRG
jgi:hypothetical protein